MNLIDRISDLAIAIASDIKGLNAKVSGFDGRLTSAEGDVSGINDRVTVLEGLHENGGGSQGGDGVFDTIKMGADSPRIAMKRIRFDVTNTSMNYNADGSLTKAWNMGVSEVNLGVSPKDIIAVNHRAFYMSNGAWVREGKEGVGNYYEFYVYENSVGIQLMNMLHAESAGKASKNGQLFFDRGGFFEIYVTYKVD